jgi:hypothetical protein
MLTAVMKRCLMRFGLSALRNSCSHSRGLIDDVSLLHIQRTEKLWKILLLIITCRENARICNPLVLQIMLNYYANFVLYDYGEITRQLF